MGKRPRGSALKAKKRAKIVVEELQEGQAEEIAQRSVPKLSKDLFVLDAKGTNRGIPHQYQLRSEKKKKREKVKQALSTKDQRAVEKLLQSHDKEKLVRLAREGKQVLEGKVGSKLRSGVRASSKNANFDLWENEGGDADDNKTATASTSGKRNSSSVPSPGIGASLAGTAPLHPTVQPRPALPPPKPADSTIKVDVAAGGQSYRPDQKQHVVVLEKAVALEERRNAAERYKNAPLSQGMAPETKALLLTSDDEEDSSKEEGCNSTIGDSDDGPNVPLPKRTVKLTRSQRNKQKRLRQERAAEKKARRKKRLLNEISEIPRYQKELKREEKERQEKMARQQKQRQGRPLGKEVELAMANRDPIEAPSLAVALPSELKGKHGSGLRTVKPKGNLLTDRCASFQERQLVAAAKGNARNNRNRRRRRLNVKGKRSNKELAGADFVVMGV